MRTTSTVKTDKIGNAAKRSKSPWMTEYFEQSLNAHDRIMQVARMSANGIAMHLARPNAIRALEKVKSEFNISGVQLNLDHAENDAILAQREVDEDFPVLNGFVTIALWSWIEDFAQGLLAVWLINNPSSLQSPAILKLKIRAGDLLNRSKTDQAYVIVEPVYPLDPPSELCH